MGLPIAVGTYPIDTAHSQLCFSLVHLGISVIRGTFDQYSGELEVGDSLENTSVTIDAEMDSINTGNALRDKNVRVPEYLDVDNHPHMSFRSTSITEVDAGYSLTGDLTIKDVTVPTTFDVTYNGEAIFPIDGSTHFGFTGRTVISRSAFGVSHAPEVISDELGLTLDVRFVRPPANG